jgi:protocatechuate 3,4-dioxygenase beta subunit
MLFIPSCNGQQNANTKPTTSNGPLVGGPFEGNDIVYIGMPETINNVDTSAGWFEAGQKLLVTGTVYQRDGITPAKDVIIYYWQTDNTGRYSRGAGVPAGAARHGHIRGWMKTDATGKYALYTVRPAPYPDEKIPAHIHLALKEPGINEYYTDDLQFDDDKLFTTPLRNAMETRAGSGVLRVVNDGQKQIAEHNIICGLNIPNYPANSSSSKKESNNPTITKSQSSNRVNPTNPNSGLEIGEDQPSIVPFHAWGPDKGTRTCPVCKYGRYAGWIYFVGNKPDWPAIEKWLVFAEQESATRKKYFKAYFVYGNPDGYNKQQRQTELEALGKKLNLVYTALTYVPSLDDRESDMHLNKLNPDVATVVMYRHRNIIRKYIDPAPTPDNFAMVRQVLDGARSEYDAFE